MRTTRSRARSAPLTSLFTTLVATLLVGAVLALTPGTAHAGTASDELGFLRQLNQTRVANGRAPLVLDGGLSGDARRWSANMSAKNNLFHTPTTQMLAEVLGVVGKWLRVGENVGVGHSVATLHNAFWNSSGHRANMLGDFNRVGIGVHYGRGRLWVTFRFVKGPAINGPTGLAATVAFPDVFADTYFADAVRWLVKEGITTGVGSSGLFKPHDGVNRAQMATFLWRLAGEPRARAARFADVPSNAYYADAVSWLRAQGLTTGMGGTNRYEPGAAVTREQMATFLWRFAGAKDVSGGHGFVDVAPGYAAEAIAWAAQYDITTGTGGGRFSPRDVVSRAQMATFLHRLATTGRAFSAAGIRIP